MHSRQHAARQRARHGARLGPRTRHGAAQPVAAVAPHRLGGRGAVAGRRLPLRHQRSAGGHRPLDWIVETGATYVMGVPTHAMDVLAQQKARGLERLGRVSVFYMAGAPIPPSVAAAFVAQGIKPQNVYGMTENSSHQYTHPDDDTAISVTTCGRGGPGYEVRLFDPADRDRRGGAGRGGRDRRARRRADARLLRQPDRDRDELQSRRLVPVAAISASLDERGNLKVGGPLEGPHHPRRPQHLSRAHRGAGAAARRRRARRLLPGGRRAARRARLHRRQRAAVAPDELLAHLAARASPSTTCRSISSRSRSSR